MKHIWPFPIKPNQRHMDQRRRTLHDGTRRRREGSKGGPRSGKTVAATDLRLGDANKAIRRGWTGMTEYGDLTLFHANLSFSRSCVEEFRKAELGSPCCTQSELRRVMFFLFSLCRTVAAVVHTSAVMAGRGEQTFSGLSVLLSHCCLPVTS